MAVKAYALITLTDCYDGTDGTVHRYFSGAKRIGSDK